MSGIAWKHCPLEAIFNVQTDFVPSALGDSESPKVAPQCGGGDPWSLPVIRLDAGRLPFKHESTERRLY